VAWQVQDAEQKLSEIVQRAIDDGPQIVTRDGEEVAVVVSIQEYRKTKELPMMDFKEFLMSGPAFDDLDLERIRDFPRDVEL
jgi:antitoxin Phd